MVNANVVELTGSQRVAIANIVEMSGGIESLTEAPNTYAVFVGYVWNGQNYTSIVWPDGRTQFWKDGQ